MKFNFKPLSSFFSSNKSEEQKDTKEEKKEGNDQGGDQGNDEEDSGDDQGETKNETGDDQDKSAKNGKETGKDATINVSVKEYKSFVAAQAELEKFGKNAEDRNNFLKDAAQLHAWYEAAAGTGATSNSDANAQEKSTKKLSKVTQDAKEAYNKSASQK
jgi:hypothetical protein